MAVKAETGGAKPGLLLLPRFGLALTFRHPKLKAKDCGRWGMSPGLDSPPRQLTPLHPAKLHRAEPGKARHAPQMLRD